MKALTAEEQKMVLDGAVQLFTKSDLRDITLDTLARTCGISAFNIVRHYQSRENILTAVLERELELMAAAAHAPELRMPGETWMQGVFCEMGQPPCPGMTPRWTSAWTLSAPVLIVTSPTGGASARRGSTERGIITTEPLGSRAPFQG